jgi:hypothetical protein
VECGLRIRDHHLGCAQTWLPAVQGRNSSIGSVSATDGASLPEGYYRLRTDDERIRVKNNGLGQWTILAPL